MPPHGTTRTTRLRKCQCGECGYTARISRSWLARGLPGCPCGGKLIPATAEEALAALDAGHLAAEDLDGHLEIETLEREWRRIEHGRSGKARRDGGEDIRLALAKTREGRLPSDALALERVQALRALEAHKARHAALAAHAFGGEKTPEPMPF